MEIKDKQVFKIEVKKKIDKFVWEFPIYFYGNLIINLFLVVIILSLSFFTLAILWLPRGGELSGYVIIAIVVAVFILRITLKGLFRNIRILKNIYAGDYDFEIEDYEMDNAVEFIEDFPVKKEDVERMRTSLSFNKIIDVLETASIIMCEEGVYSMDLFFKHSIENLIKEEDKSV
jgi:hypothetical protein